MKKLFLHIGIIFSSVSICAQQSHKDALLQTSMQLLSKYIDTSTHEPKLRWSYDMGVVLEGAASMWKSSANGDYLKYIQNCIDPYLGADGHIKTYNIADYNIDNIKNGRALLLLYKVTLQKKYLTAATELWNQLKQQPRTNSGGFWHKNIYPNQIWLDGLYMAQPFYIEYAAMANKDSVFDDVVNQFIYIAEKTTDPITGLMYHGLDETKIEKWSNPNTGLSPHFWARAMGWYMMALVDILDYLPENNAKRPQLLKILNNCAKSIVKVQSKKNSLWYDILDLENKSGNYPEASASSMFVYTLAKGVLKQYLPSDYLKSARRGFSAIEKEFIEIKDGQTNLNGTVSVSGLGGKKYRDGSFEYYMSEKVVTNDLKGIGAYLLAADEIDKSYTIKPIKRTVLLDNFFNNEYIKSPFGLQPFHYLWAEEDNNGFSFWGNVWNDNGYRWATLKTEPKTSDLSKANVFIIVDPDNAKETKSPNYMSENYATIISDWVKNGGKLILLANDSGNCDLTHFNILAEKFGFQFNMDLKNKVQGHQFEQGAIEIPTNNQVFPNTKKIYIKEISTFKINDTKNVKSILSHKGDIVMVGRKFGKGTVFAVGDPWLYNEYVDGRKLPADYQNFQAAKDLVKWISKL
ncbi:glycoside hydrolase family 88 protein [Rhizosphaericola mali]|uniref:Glycoside hydrolase family 88 protein n=1 Tax=Rhizosphaericola mali TaxID=2545455 RepID=A0A5P2G262_9BACT|nr:glycoside hydrolase family 88 protein [Rhizosphaericola mali]QES88808.1 glycoside hydrolase family 88 protein [Rhizosphaericola mali]